MATRPGPTTTSTVTPRPPLGARDVAVRYVHSKLWRPRGILSSAEWAELGRLPTPEARRDYLAAHEIARILLGEWTGTHPAQVRFRQSALGTPELVPVDAAAAPHFSLSYADDVALCAVASGRVGVFVASFRHVLTEAASAAWDALPPPERKKVEALPAHTRTEHLLVQWTRREAASRVQWRGVGGPRVDVTSIRLTEEHVAAVALMGTTSGASLKVEEMA